MKKPEITGIVLAGGKSSRMGTDKSLLKWKGKTLIEHAVETIKPVCIKVVISSNKKVYGFTGCDTWPDELPGQAPIIGIYSCLKRSETEINIFLSCDMPYLRTDLLRHMIDRVDNHPLLVPVNDDGLLEPLCGIYRKTIIPHLEKHIRHNNLSIYEFIREHGGKFLKLGKELPFYDSNLFANINTPDDLKELLNNSE